MRSYYSLLVLLLLTNLIYPSFSVTNQNNNFQNDDTIVSSPYQSFEEDTSQISNAMEIEKREGQYFDGFNLFMLEQRGVDSKGTYMIIDMDGNIIKTTNSDASYSSVLPINSTTFALATSFRNVSLWDYRTGEVQELFRAGIHHDLSYNPHTNTFIGIKHLKKNIDGLNYRYQELIEVTTDGQTIWSLDLSNYFPPSVWNGFEYSNGLRDVTHANTVFWDITDDSLYVNLRNINTFVKINHTTKELLWGIGEYGDFTLYDRFGNQRENLFFHAHSVEKLNSTNFILFDNDYFNSSGSSNSRMMEIRVNKTSRTARTVWQWTPDRTYFSAGWSDADRLPNGNTFGTFGYINHPGTNKGARLVEVNPKDEVVWKLDFTNNEDYVYGIYRSERFLYTPFLEGPEYQVVNPGEKTTITWDTAYNFRTKYEMNGSFEIYYNDQLVKSSNIIFKQFWRKTPITFNTGSLDFGIHNFTIKVIDEGGHYSKSTVMVYSGFKLDYLGKHGFELGFPGKMIWNGYATQPLELSIQMGGETIHSMTWDGGDIIISTKEFDVGLHVIDLELSVGMSSFIIQQEIRIFRQNPPVIDSHIQQHNIMQGQTLTIKWTVVDYSNTSIYLWENQQILIQDDIRSNNTYEVKFAKTFQVVGTYLYNLTIVDYFGQISSQISEITVFDKSKPLIYPRFTEVDFSWGTDIELQWLVEQAENYQIFKNGSFVASGNIINKQVVLSISGNDKYDWLPGYYNITLLALTEDQDKTAYSTIISINIGDPYADSFLSQYSQGGTNFHNSIGAPDNNYATISTQYLNGYVTLDMGNGEEIINGEDVDFEVIAMGGIFSLSGSNDLINFENLGLYQGNTSIDLGSTFETLRYIRVEYNQGEAVSLDAIVANHYKKHDNIGPRVLQGPDDLTLSKKNQSLMLHFEILEIFPSHFKVFFERQLVDEQPWSETLFEYELDLSRIDGQTVVKFEFWDKYQQLGIWQFTIKLETSQETRSYYSIWFFAPLILFLIRRRKLR